MVMTMIIGLRYLCNICKDVNDSSYEEYSKLLKKAERAAATKDSRYMRDDMKEQMAAAKTGAMDTPSTSPTPHGHHAQAGKPLSPLRYDPSHCYSSSFLYLLNNNDNDMMTTMIVELQRRI
jgi:hypothetical protein